MASIVSHAAGQATVISDSGAKIRQEASTTSTMVGGAEKGKVLEVVSQVQGSDGYVWYQVKSGATTGYVRSDLVEVTGDVGGGETGGEGAEGGETAGGDPGAEAPSGLIEVNPVSATVYGEAVEIKDSASDAGQSLGTVPNETVLTVTGYVTEGENVWYQVSYNAEGSQINGFIFSEYVSLSEDLTPVGAEPPADTAPSEPAPETKRYDTLEQNGKWLLVDSENPTEGYVIEDLFAGVQGNAESVAESEQKVKTQKIIIIVLVFLLVAAVAGIAFLVFKVRDMMDSAYFNEVENDTLRKRNSQDGQSRQKVMHSVGAEKQPGRTAGTRTQGTAAGQRTAGAGTVQRTGGTVQRTAAPSQDPRTAGSGQRGVVPSQDSRTAGSGQRTVRPQDPRMTAAGQGRTTASGQRPVGSGTAGSGQRTVTPSQQRTVSSAQGQRTVNPAQGQRPSAPVTRTVEGSREQGVPQGARPGASSAQGSAQKPQPKNFMADDDEFDFEFLNYDGDDEQ